MASIVKEGLGWRAMLYVKGMRESSTFSLKRDAQAWAKTREKELREICEQSGEALSREERQFLKLSDLYSEEKIVSTAFDVRSASGIYFLIRDGKVVYVGKSMNVHVRVATHQKSKEFDKINFIECPQGYLHRLEQLYIRKFNPELNIAGRSDRLEEVEWRA